MASRRTKDALAQLKREFRREASFNRLKKSDLDEIGKKVINGIIAETLSGRSPITGQKFPAYKNPKKYPGKPNGPIRRRYPDKKTRPVNLKLSGDFLSSLTFNAKKGKNASIIVRFNNSLSNKKEEGHRKGVKGQPKRPIIPLRNETFSPRLLGLLKRLVLPIVKRSF